MRRILRGVGNLFLLIFGVFAINFAFYLDYGSGLEGALKITLTLLGFLLLWLVDRQYKHHDATMTFGGCVRGLAVLVVFLVWYRSTGRITVGMFIAAAVIHYTGSAYRSRKQEGDHQLR